MSAVTAIRPFMQRRIDTLHAEIARLVGVEKAYRDRAAPEKNALMLQIRDCRIDVSAMSPEMRRTCRPEP